MVLLTTTPRILSAISALAQPLPNSANPQQLPTDLDTPIDHKALIALSRALLSLPHTTTTITATTNNNNHNPDLKTQFTLNSLLQSTRPYHAPPPPKPTPTPEYRALKAKLLKQQEQRAYNRLVHAKSAAADSTSPEDAEDGGEDNISPSLVLNILLSIVLCAFAVFHVTRSWRNDGLRVLCSLGAGIVVAVAEVVVYSAYLRKVAEAKEKEGRKRERKVVMIDPVEDSKRLAGTLLRRASRDGDKVEIWGKGVNGGVRRRVREQWEKGQERDGEHNG